jgi:hypothetical protein
MIIKERMAMKGETNAFKRRQATRLVEIAGSCDDPELKKRLLELADDWLNGVSPGIHRPAAMA